MSWFAIGLYLFLFILGFCLLSRFELWRLALKRKVYIKELRDEYTLRIMRNFVRGRGYQLKDKEKIEYKQIFETCPFAANVFLVLLEIGEGESIVLPSDINEKVSLLEHLVEIRFFNPFKWQLEEHRANIIK